MERLIKNSYICIYTQDTKNYVSARKRYFFFLIADNLVDSVSPAYFFKKYKNSIEEILVPDH